jgi:hypothetical protein
VSIFENIRTRAKQAGMDANKDTLYNFFVQVSDQGREWLVHVVLAVFCGYQSVQTACAPP